MSRKKFAVLGCVEKDPDSVIHRAEEVVPALTGNIIYLTPHPSLAELTTGLTEAVNARSAWGTPGARGSTADKVIYKEKVAILFVLVKQMCAYVNNTTPNDEAALATTGFPLSADVDNLPLLDPPGDLRRMISNNIGLEKVKMKWDRPANAAKGQDIIYLLLRSTSPSLATATVIVETTKAAYIDTPGALAAGSYYYWVKAVSSAGTSEPSDMLVAQVMPLT